MRYLAFDMGAESGRVISGALEEGCFLMRELTRFPNEMVSVGGHLHWDVSRLFGEVKEGLRIFAEETEEPPASVGIDTWGVDFALLDAYGDLLGMPYTYRDPWAASAMKGFFKRVPRERVYELTGVQLMPFNTLFQLFALEQHDYRQVQDASDLLFMPDLFNYFLTGKRCSEFTFATTSQLFNPRTNDWEEELLGAAGARREMMQDVVAPGTVIGTLTDGVRREVGIDAEVPVVAVGSHDTASAVAAVPAEGYGWAFISCGTWSLMGVERNAPVIDEDTMRMNFTNEGGVDGTFRLLKNITGLWLLKRCRDDWMSSSVHMTYDRLAEMAGSAAPFSAVIDPDHKGFSNPPAMPVAIAVYCLNTEQEVPEGPAQLARVILESLALKYREVLEQLRLVHTGDIDRIHMVGGGARNSLLCQFAADATGLPVIAGPYEATAIGNVMVQAQALGRVSGLEESREIIRRSFEPIVYRPGDPKPWDEAYERLSEARERARAADA